MWRASNLLAMQAAVVEEVNVIEGGELNIVQTAPGAVLADELGLVRPVERLRQGVVVGIAAGAHGGDRAGVGQALGVTDRQVLG